MINIIIYGNDNVPADFEEWQLGDPKSSHVRGLHGTYLHVIATDRELDWIRVNVTGIRLHPGNQVRWIGEDAVFIANSLPKPEELEGRWI